MRFRRLSPEDFENLEFEGLAGIISATETNKLEDVECREDEIPDNSLSNDFYKNKKLCCESIPTERERERDAIVFY